MMKSQWDFFLILSKNWGIEICSRSLGRWIQIPAYLEDGEIVIHHAFEKILKEIAKPGFNGQHIPSGEWRTAIAISHLSLSISPRGVSQRGLRRLITHASTSICLYAFKWANHLYTDRKIEFFQKGLTTYSK